jgi:hypothetical protein
VILFTNASWIPKLDVLRKLRCLADIQCSLGGFGFARLDAACVAHTTDRIPDAGLRIPEVLAAARAEVTRVRVDAEPVTVEVRVSAVRASHVPHRVAEHGRCHVVDRVKLITLDLDFAMLIAFPRTYGAPLSAQQTAPDDSTINSVLGKSHGDANQYTADQLKLFATYHTVFKLGSKPAEHLQALGQLTDDQLKVAVPPSLTKLIAFVQGKLAGLPE